MEPINIILIFLVIIVIFLVIYLIITFLLKSTVKIQEIKETKETIEIPTPPNINIKKEECQQTLVLDYDEIDFNEIKKNSKESKNIFEIEQKTFNPKIKLTKIPYVRTYMDLPGYKAYNLESLNSMELKDNNYGLINYNELKSNERFKAKNSLI
jgi:hypothetical protein